MIALEMERFSKASSANTFILLDQFNCHIRGPYRPSVTYLRKALHMNVRHINFLYFERFRNVMNKSGL